jgi:hypothetical protein
MNYSFIDAIILIACVICINTINSMNDEDDASGSGWDYESGFGSS